MWLKYSNEPIKFEGFTDREQPDRLGAYDKPRGCWITDDSEHCWREWCEGESFALEGLTHKHEVVLDERNILILHNPFELDEFTRDFGTTHWWGGDDDRKYAERAIDWRKVAARYDGLIITPYQWERRMSGFNGCDYNWYYTWDCASGCIWMASAIKDIRLIEVLPLKKAEAA